MGTWIAEHAIAAAISVLAGLLATFLAKKLGSIMDAIEAKTNIDIDDKVELVRNSKDGCGEVIVKLLKKRIIRVVVQFGFNVEDDGGHK